MEILYYFKPFNANYKKGRLITSYSFLEGLNGVMAFTAIG